MRSERAVLRVRRTMQCTVCTPGMCNTPFEAEDAHAAVCTRGECDACTCAMCMHMHMCMHIVHVHVHVHVVCTCMCRALR